MVIIPDTFPVSSIKHGVKNLEGEIRNLEKIFKLYLYSIIGHFMTNRILNFVMYHTLCIGSVAYEGYRIGVLRANADMHPLFDSPVLDNIIMNHTGDFFDVYFLTSFLNTTAYSLGFASRRLNNIVTASVLGLAVIAETIDTAGRLGTPTLEDLPIAFAAATLQWVLQNRILGSTEASETEELLSC